MLLELEEYGVKRSTDAMVTEFKSSIYDKYLCTLSCHITQQFPDINLIEGFEIFNPNEIPQELA